MRTVRQVQPIVGRWDLVRRPPLVVVRSFQYRAAIASLVALLVFAFVQVAHAQQDANARPSVPSTNDGLPNLATLSIEQLLDVEVTIVSKKQERAGGAAAALTVITGDDIRRSGASSFPEALRLVPGLHVSRVSSSIWEVSSRGFSSSNSAKLLVLMDGRSVYTPLFSGVFWDVQDTFLPDVERMEVIRGPGASIWGANAMNGVINILTKSAKETKGVVAEAGGGTHERGFAGLRYGGQVGERVFYRVYGKVADHGAGFNPPPTTDDHWRRISA